MIKIRKDLVKWAIQQKNILSAKRPMDNDRFIPSISSFIYLFISKKLSKL